MFFSWVHDKTTAVKVKLPVFFFFGAGLVPIVSFLLICMYLNYLVYITMIHQGIAVYFGYTLLQKAQGSYVACFGLL